MNKFVKMLSLMVSILSMAVFVGCTDDNLDNREADYRDGWVGIYVGESEYHYSANDGQFLSDTIYPNDSLSVEKNNSDGLTIGYRSQLFVVKCTAEGDFSHENYPHGGCEGSCFDDSLYFMSDERGQGRSLTCFFKGRKIKRTSINQELES